MFYLNIGYNTSMATNMQEINNVTLLSTGLDSRRLLSFPRQNFQNFLLDPQVYLSILNPEDCSKSCARLLTHEWFILPDTPQLGEFPNKTDWINALKDFVVDNWNQTQLLADINAVCKASILRQQAMQCSQIILPAPLIDQRGNESAILGDWLDKGIRISKANEIGQPLIASIVIHENEINNAAFSQNGFLDTIVDHVQSREEIEGVYISVLQNSAHHPFDTDANVVKVYMYLCNAFSELYDIVIVNFSDIFGYACMGCGATSLCNGASHSLRILLIDNFKDDGFGYALPSLYSHQSAAEYKTETDLDVAVGKKLLRRVEDITPYSEPLMTTLRKGERASSLPAWAESRNNSAQSNKHFLARIIVETDDIRANHIDKKYETIYNWLEDADVNQVYIDSISEGLGKKAPVRKWKEILEEVCGE